MFLNIGGSTLGDILFSTFSAAFSFQSAEGNEWALKLSIAFHNGFKEQCRLRSRLFHFKRPSEILNAVLPTTNFILTVESRSVPPTPKFRR